MTTSFRFLARRLLLRLLPVLPVLPVLALLAVTPGARAQTPPLATLQAAGSELVFTPAVKAEPSTAPAPTQSESATEAAQN